MSGYESLIDRQIRRAREEGAFDDLPGEGKPDPNLDEVKDPHWWAKKFIQREGLEGGVLPPALELRRERERTLAGLADAQSEREARARLLALNDRIKRMNARGHSGPPSNASPLDVDEMLALWRRRADAARAEEPGAE